MSSINNLNEGGVTAGTRVEASNAALPRNRAWANCLLFMLFGFCSFVTVVLLLLALNVLLTVLSSFSNHLQFQIWELKTLFWRNSELTLPPLMLLLLLFYVSVRMRASRFSYGSHVAKFLQARHVYPATRDASEKRALEAVREVSSAYKFPEPPVFVLDEEFSINGFVAGTRIPRAAVVLTTGAVHTLTKDELQAFLAVGFASILSGRSHLKAVLTSILWNFEWPAIRGKELLSEIKQRSKWGGEKDLSSLQLAASALTTIGEPLLFCTRLFKALVCRIGKLNSDEMQADIPFKVDALALSNVYKKTLELRAGSVISSTQGELFSAFFICNIHRDGVRLPLDIHISTEKRIEQLDPLWDGTVIRRSYEQLADGFAARSDSSGKEVYLFSLAANGTVLQLSVSPFSTKGRLVGEVPEELKKLVPVIEDIPATIFEQAYEPYGARALIYALLLAPDEYRCFKQLSYLRQNQEHFVYSKLKNILKVLEQLTDEQREFLIQLVVPVLWQLSKSELQEFYFHCTRLAKFAGRMPNYLVQWLDDLSNYLTARG